MPLLTQRWTVLPPQAAGALIIDTGSRFPNRSEYGGRWRHTGSLFEAGFSYFDGYNHLPALDVRPVRTDLAGRSFTLTRVFPRIRTYGLDAAIPTRWITLKGEGELFLHPNQPFAEYGLYVAELERQVGEWLLTLGYAGQFVTKSGPLPLAFDPERSLADSIIGRASYTVDPRRTVSVDVVARPDGDGYYLKPEYSQILADYWRLTFGGVLIGGDERDFIGQFNHNSHLYGALRVSF
jgi:hypothetical protein